MSAQTQAQKLKSISEQKQALSKEQKEIRKQLDANKEERKEARSKMASIRKGITPQKASIRDSVASVYGVLSKGSIDDINELADSITESAASLAKSIREFAESKSSI